MIGAATNNYMHVIGSQQQMERNAELEWAAVSGEDRCVTTLITAAKETKVELKIIINWYNWELKSSIGFLSLSSFNFQWNELHQLTNLNGNAEMHEA